MINVTTPYLELTPNFNNEFMPSTSRCIKNVLNKHFGRWEGFKNEYPDYILSIFFVKKRGTDSLLIKGPTVSKRYKTVEYSLFLLDEINDLSYYLDTVFDGIGIILEKYGVSNSEVLNMKKECKKDLEL